MLSTGQVYRTYAGHKAIVFAEIGNSGLQYPFVVYVMLPDGPNRLQYAPNGRSELADRGLDIILPQAGNLCPVAQYALIAQARQVLRPFQVLQGNA